MSIGFKILIAVVIIVVLVKLFKFFMIVPSPRATRGRIIFKSEEDTTKWDYFPGERTITIQDDFGNQSKVDLSMVTEEEWNDLRVDGQYDENSQNEE